jgi:signal transduction histidine kinase
VARGIAAFEKGRLVARNEQFMELLRIPAELGGIGTAAARLEKDGAGGLLADLTEQLSRARDAKQDIVIERTRADGAIFQLFFSPPRDGVAVFGAHDATVQRQSERFMQNAQKMEALGHLTGGIAHDFNNLLTVVLMNLDVMRKNQTIVEKFGRHIDLMIAASSKGATLVRQLLAYARKQPLEAEIIDLRDVMPGLVDLIKRTIGEDVDVNIKVSDDIWPTNVDPAQFESTLLNLALNARDAMPDGGSLILELANVTLGADYAKLHGEVVPGDYVLFAVSDTGSGMTDEVLSHAFDPFFTTKGDGEGNGLGLSMAYGFVKQTGGHIKLCSAPGKGTTVRLYFPRCREAATAKPSSPSVSAPTGTETILVVEDDDRVRTTTVGVLAELGYNTLQAADGQSALTVLETKRPVDLLFTDMVLSGSVNGRMLAEAARELQPAIRVLYTSGYTEKAERHRDELDWGTGLLSKPYCADELAMKVRHVMCR